MSTDYPVYKTEHVELSVGEHSAVLYLTLHLGNHGTIDIAYSLSPEDMAEVAIKILGACLYNCGDPKVFKKWLHKRLDEAYYSPDRTSLEDFKPRPPMGCEYPLPDLTPVTRLAREMLRCGS